MTGVQRFATELVRAMDRVITLEADKYTNICFQILCPINAIENNDLGLTAIHTRVVGRTRGYVWEQIELPIAARGRLILNLGNIAPIFANKIITIHDAIVWEMPENYRWYFRLSYKMLLPIIAKTSKHCITVSEESKASLLRHGITGDVPVSVIYNGVDHIHRLSDSRVSEKIEWPERIVFSLGSSSPNKNFSLLSRLAPELRKIGISMVIAGAMNPAVFGVTTEIESSIQVLGRISDAAICEAYRRAIAFIFPSFYEGFGIPPLEAMAMGCPVVASNTSAIPEILGDAAIYRSPYSIDGWCDAISELANNRVFSELMGSRGVKRAADFCWDTSARKLLDLLSEYSRSSICNPS